jgi:hypothetical protein
LKVRARTKELVHIIRSSTISRDVKSKRADCMRRGRETGENSGVNSGSSQEEGEAGRGESQNAREQRDSCQRCNPPADCFRGDSRGQFDDMVSRGRFVCDSPSPDKKSDSDQIVGFGSILNIACFESENFVLDPLCAVNERWTKHPHTHQGPLDLQQGLFQNVSQVGEQVGQGSRTDALVRIL